MIADALLKRRRVLLTFALALTLAGLHAFNHIPRRLEPPVKTDVGVVEMQLPGVSVAEFGTLLTEPVAESVRRIPNVREVTSTTRDGAAAIVVTVDGKGPRADRTFTAIRDQLALLREELSPRYLGLVGPRLVRTNGDLPELVLYVAQRRASTAGLTPPPPVEASRELERRLLRLDAVARVDRVGEPAEQLVLTYNDRDLSDARLTPILLRQYLQAQTFTAPGGYLRRGGAFVPIETDSRLDSQSALEQLPIRDPSDGRTIALKRLVDVERQLVDPPLEIVRGGGEPAIALAVVRVDGANLDRFESSVLDVLNQFRDDHQDLDTRVIVSQPELVHQELNNFRANVLQSFVAILVLLVVALGFRYGMTVALVVLMVVLTSFLLLRFDGFHLDLVTLSSFVLVLGLLVDNHIVMAERIHRLRRAGIDGWDAITQALRELWGPLLAASATTVVGFLPVQTTDHFVGDYLRDLFRVVSVTLFTSLAFCVVITPLLLSPRRRAATSPAEAAPTPPPTSGATPTRRDSLYASVLRPLCRSWPLLALCVVAAGTWGIYYFQQAERVFFPASSRPLWMLQIEEPQGTDVATTLRAVEQVERFLVNEQKIEDSPILDWVSFVGRTAPAFQASLPVQRFAPHYAQMLLNLDPARDPRNFAARLRAHLSGIEDGAHRRLRPIRLGAQIDWPIAISILGPDEELFAAAEGVKQRLAGLPCRDVGTDWEKPIDKLKLQPDRAALADKNLTVAQLTLGMHSVLQGIPVGVLEEKGRELPILLRAKVSRDDPKEALMDAYVYPDKGEASILYEVAKVENVPGLPVMVRRDGEACITVHAEAIDDGAELAVGRDIAAQLAPLQTEFPGLRFEVGGAYDAEQRANRALLKEAPWALLLVLLFLLLQSQSIRETLLTLLCIPVSFTGVAIGLYLFDEPVSFMNLVGMTALAGLVVNNAIVLISSLRRRVDAHQPNGIPLIDDLIDSAADRFRPIVLTTLCAITSMGVLYQSGGPMWRPLAITIISGLMFSTLLVLFVLPPLYAGVRRVPVDPVKPTTSTTPSTASEPKT